MKQLLILILIILSSSFTTHLFAQQNDFIEEYLERFKNSKKYLIAVAENMPEAKYAFKATSESKSFSENLMHICWAMDWHSQSLLGGREARDWRTDMELRVGEKSKKEIIATIDRTFDETIKLIREFEVTKLDDMLNYFGLNRSKRQILLLLADHITHHRGQMIVAMRLNGLVPPRYVLFQ